MTYLLIFAPWIAFAIASGAGWAVSAVAGLLVALVVIVRGMRSGSGPDALIIEIGSGAFFVVLAVVALWAPDSAARPYTAAASLAWLGAITWGMLAAGRPFTLAIARRSVPAQLWDHPGFRRVNVVISLVWSVAFTVCAAVLAVLVAGGAGPSVTIPVQVLGFVLPMVFTVRYPALTQGRAGRDSA